MPDGVAEEFLARLWRLQDAAGISSKDLATRIGVSRSYLSRLKTGDRGQNLSLDLALRIAKEFPELLVFLASISPTIKTPEMIGTEAEGTTTT